MIQPALLATYPLLHDAVLRCDQIDRGSPPFESIDQVRAGLHAELAGLRQALEAPPEQKSWKTVRDRLVGLIAVSLRGCRDLRIETADAAFNRDIPW